MKRRLNLAVSLLHAPSLVLLDEPTVGVDPQSRNHLFEMVEAQKRAGTTLVYTTHYMEEAERLCDRVAVLDRGRMVALGTVDELVASTGGREQIELALAETAPERLAHALAGLAFVQRGPVATLTGQGAAALPDVLARCARHDVAVRSVTLRKPNLESVFLALTGHALRD
jgi:ABC-2 type transport system ATP-binding protein